MSMEHIYVQVRQSLTLIKEKASCKFTLSLQAKLLIVVIKWTDFGLKSGRWSGGWLGDLDDTADPELHPKVTVNVGDF